MALRFGQWLNDPPSGWESLAILLARISHSSFFALYGILFMSGCAVATPTVMTLSFPQQGGTLAMIPATYRQGTLNPWVLYLHGFNQDANTMLTGGYGEVAALLVKSGYVVIGMTNTTQNCYGNAQCSVDVAAVSAIYQSALTLQRRPYVLADSMGGFTALNAISARAIVPRAVVGWCINTDLDWDYVSGGAAAPVTADYDISAAQPYAVATAGYDPMLQSSSAYATIPFALWSSYSDTVVSRAVNTDRFAAMINQGGGSVVVHTSSGEHLDASNFDPAAVLAFFRVH